MSRPDFSDTACTRLRHYMAAGAWHAARELEAIGGRRFPARLAEIARGTDGGEAMAYDWRIVDGCEGVVEYRLRAWGADEVRPQPRQRAAALEEVARENAELRARIAELERQARRWQREAQAAMDFARAV